MGCLPSPSRAGYLDVPGREREREMKRCEGAPSPPVREKRFDEKTAPSALSPTPAGIFEPTIARHWHRTRGERAVGYLLMTLLRGKAKPSRPSKDEVRGSFSTVEAEANA